MDENIELSRPAVLNNVTDTQIEELERQFEQQDDDGWKRLAEGYGWSEEEAEDVWNWFGIRPAGQR
jgi:hypothetical protein